MHVGILNNCPDRQYSYYSAKYNSDGTIDAEHQSVPVCPHCGERVDDEWYEYFPNNNENARITCYECNQVYDCECVIDYSFNSSIPDLEQEAKDKADREAERESWKQERLDASAKMPPGTRVKVVGGGTIFVGDEGVISNEENRDGYVHADVDHDGAVRKGVFFNPKDLEVVDGRR
jgi:hypothetical protein